MNVIKRPSPNCDREAIPVEYLVLHYTAVNMEDTVKIFMADDSVSAHLVIDVDGSVIEMVECLSGIAHRAWHAGISYWQDRDTFNDFAIGIELVNYNGNLFPYSEAQYGSLIQVVQKLKQFYPQLQNPHRVVGHEHIAGFRGKADPGIYFNWTRFFNEAYPGKRHPERLPVCTSEQQLTLIQQAEAVPVEAKRRSGFWQKLSERTEQLVKQHQ